MQSLLLHRRPVRDFAPFPQVAAAQRDHIASEPPRSSQSSATVTGDGEVGNAETDQVAPTGHTKEEKPNEAERDAFLVDFDSSDSGLNPKTWSLARRWVYTLMVAHIALVVGSAGSINSAVAPYASKALGVSEEVMLLDTALFLTGFGVAAPVVGPLSEIGGRKPVYIITLLIFVLFEIGTACTTTIYARCILRFFAGCAGATPLSNAGGSLADMWTPMERAYAFPVFAVSAFFGPAIGPVLGGFIGQYYHYEWCDWVTAIWGALVLVTTALFLPETFAPAILKLKASAIRKKTGDARYKTALEKLREQVPFRVHFVDAMQRPFKMLVLEPIVIVFCVYMSLVYIVLFGDLVAYSYIFEPYNLSDGVLGLTFLSICIGLLICGAFIPLIAADYRRAAAQAAEEGCPVHPEVHHRTAMVGTWLVPISLFMGGWCSYKSATIWPVLISQVLFGTGFLSIFIASYQYMIDAYLSTAASALAVLTFVRYPISGGSTLFTGPMYRNLGRHWAMSLLGFLSILMSLIPFVFYRYGPNIRSWSRYTPKVAV
ncbi:hypothetical protein JCM8097_000783 [Rhodosporidiobolus ruineniae]